MQTFRTIIPINTKKSYNYSDKFMLMGSCFAENIGDYLITNQFQTMINPFGIIFNTHSLVNIIERMVRLNYFSIEDVFENQEVWSSYEVHSCMNALSRDELIRSLNNQIDLSYQFLKNTKVFILTLGTSWVYEDKTSNKIVANCHKIPQKNFEKKILSSDDNLQNLSKIIHLIKSINPDINVILTISPVRHIKDGFIENNWSKSNLISAVHQLNVQNVKYFPSYEIMTDELRDYRFYKEDMLHPNKIAIDYIWEKFIETYFTENTLQTLKTVDQINKMKSHRVMSTNTMAYGKFQTELKNKIIKLQNQYDWMFRCLE